MHVKAIFFDVGETLVDESRDWAEWADYLGVPRFTFFATLGAVIARGEHHRKVFDIFAPDTPFTQLKAARKAAGREFVLGKEDLYPDALPCLRRLRQLGIQIGIAGNQPVEMESALKTMGVPADYIASSAAWGVEKPSIAFFERIIALTGLPPGEIAYVGDRLDNDVEPARQAGLVPVFLRRGPWAHIQALASRDLRGAVCIDMLDDLPEMLSLTVSCLRVDESAADT